MAAALPSRIELAARGWASWHKDQEYAFNPKIDFGLFALSSRTISWLFQSKRAASHGRLSAAYLQVVTRAQQCDVRSCGRVEEALRALELCSRLAGIGVADDEARMACARQIDYLL